MMKRRVSRDCTTLLTSPPMTRQVVQLHRVSFGGVTLDGCEAPGSWAPLTEDEERTIGARARLTRNERRTPEERAARVAKKAAKKAAKKEKHMR